MVGHSSVFVRLVDGQVPERSIVILEEPDLIARKGLHQLPAQHSCVAEVVAATYQQGGDFLEAGTDVHRRWGVEAVLPSLEYSVPAAAELAHKLGLPGAGPRAASILRDKLALREVTSNAGMAAPDFREIHGPEDIVEFAGTRPVVVKPADRQASMGVRVLDDVTPEAAAAAWQAMQQLTEGGVPDRPMRRRYLVEERLYGTEFSVEAIVRGRQILLGNVTEKRVVVGASPVEIGHVVPAAVDKATRSALMAATEDLIDAVEFDSGILHAEWFYDGGRPTLVECAGRCPGDHLVMLIDLAYGISVRPALIELHSGRAPAFPAHPAQAAAIEFFLPEPGVVERVERVDAARRMPGVHDLKVTAQPGDRITAWSSSWDRSGYVITVGTDQNEARRRAEAAAAAVRIRTR